MTDTIVKTKVTDRRLADLLCSALEGGSGYWAEITHIQNNEGGKPWGDEYTPTYINAPFSDDGYFTIKDAEDEKTYNVTKKDLQKGLRIMAKKYPRHFGDFQQENDDATTGDVFLQCAALGDVIYG